MATVNPPTAPTPAPPRQSAELGAQRAARARRVRMFGVGALALVVLVIAYILFGGSGGSDYQLIFNEAGQLVRGDQVQVGGVPVGSVTNIALTPQDKARITIHVDSSL